MKIGDTCPTCGGLIKSRRMAYCKGRKRFGFICQACWDVFDKSGNLIGNYEHTLEMRYG